MSDPDFKKSVMTSIGFFAGLLMAGWTHIRTLKFVVDGISDWGDLVVTALVISAGTEGANIFIKFFG